MIMYIKQVLHTAEALKSEDKLGTETLTSSMFRIQFLMLSNDFSLVIS